MWPETGSVKSGTTGAGPYRYPSHRGLITRKKHQQLIFGYMQGTIEKGWFWMHFGPQNSNQDGVITVTEIRYLKKRNKPPPPPKKQNKKKTKQKKPGAWRLQIVRELKNLVPGASLLHWRGRRKKIGQGMN